MHLVDTTLFFSPTSGGVKRYLTAKHHWLKRHTAHRHSILVPGDAHRLTPGGISTIAGMRLPGTFNYRLPLSPHKWRVMLEELEPDLIEVGDAFHPAWCAANVARRRGIPLIAFFHSNLAQLLGRRFGAGIERAVARYVHSVYDQFDLVLAPSRAMCGYLARLGVARTALQPLGVDTEIFSPLRRTLNLRRVLELPDDARLLVYAGRFSEEKNLEVLHTAMALLGKPYHLLLVGGGRRAQPAENIHVLPYRRDSVELAQWLASADALVHAGSSETFGLVIIEAMACGRPVVGVRAGAVPELVDARTGELAEPDNAPSMVRAIRRLYDRNLEALGAAARQRVLQRYTWSHSLGIELANYASVFAGTRAMPSVSAAMEFGSPGS
ncbi:MAG TPA: glycosyltransferase [Steroidobacteraceae bacterium]|jgi:alpha-1,6-mannosyltransferase